MVIIFFEKIYGMCKNLHTFAADLKMWKDLGSLQPQKKMLNKNFAHAKVHVSQKFPINYYHQK